MSGREYLLATLALLTCLSVLSGVLAATQPANVCKINKSINAPVYIYYEIGTGQQWLVANASGSLYLVGAISPYGTLITTPHYLYSLSALKGPLVGWYADGHLQLYRTLPKPYVFQTNTARR